MLELVFISSEGTSAIEQEYLTITTVDVEKQSV